VLGRSDEKVPAVLPGAGGKRMCQQWIPKMFDKDDGVTYTPIEGKGNKEIHTVEMTTTGRLLIRTGRLLIRMERVTMESRRMAGKRLFVMRRVESLGCFTGRLLVDKHLAQRR